MRFQLYDMMEELLGGHHDIEFPIVGTAYVLEIWRPDLLFTDIRQVNQPPSPISHCKKRLIRGKCPSGVSA